MSTENTETPVEPTDVDLDSFAVDFFGQKSPTPEPASSEEESTTEEESDATNDDTQADETDTLEDVSDDTDAEDDSDKEEPKKKKSRFQERIDELTGKSRDAERRLQLEREEKETLLKRLEALEQKLTPQPQNEKSDPSKGPEPDDVNEDGTDKYPLGEFDPTYIRDLDEVYSPTGT
jgi:hypothetical protein